MARVSMGNTSLTVRYAELAPGEAKKSTALQQAVSVVAVRWPPSKSQAVPKSSRPESRYVSAIMMWRPTVSKSRPSRRGPRKFPAAMTAK
jgi:hypothetical protein